MTFSTRQRTTSSLRGGVRRIECKCFRHRPWHRRRETGTPADRFRVRPSQIEIRSYFPGRAGSSAHSPERIFARRSIRPRPIRKVAAGGCLVSLIRASIIALQEAWLANRTPCAGRVLAREFARDLSQSSERADPGRGDVIMSNDLYRLTATEAARQIDAGTLKPADLMEACLDRIAAREPAIHAFRPSRSGRRAPPPVPSAGQASSASRSASRTSSTPPICPASTALPSGPAGGRGRDLGARRLDKSDGRRGDRQDRHHRVRDPQARPDHEPRQPSPHARRLVLRLRGRRRRRPVPARLRHPDRRQRHPPGRLLWRRRLQTELWLNQPHRHEDHVRQPRYGRRHGTLGRRLRAPSPAPSPGRDLEPPRHRSGTDTAHRHLPLADLESGRAGNRGVARSGRRQPWRAPVRSWNSANCPEPFAALKTAHQIVMNAESARALGWELATHPDGLSEGLRERMCSSAWTSPRRH